MIKYDKVFRVRITGHFQDKMDTAEAKWKHRNRWVRAGVFYREILELGLEAHIKNSKPKR